MPKRYSSKEIIKLIEASGWYYTKAKGSHWQFEHSARVGKVTVPHPKAELPPGTANSILKQAGLKNKIS